MIVLGIQEAHDASAAIMIDGKLVAAAQEERFTRLKGDYGFPVNAIKYCLYECGITFSDVDLIALASHNWNPVLTKIKRNANFSVQDWVDEQHKFWKFKLGLSKHILYTSLNYYNLFKDRKNFSYDNFYEMDDVLNGYMDKSDMDKMKEIRVDAISKFCQISKHKIVFVTHEDCHAYYSFFGSNASSDISHERDKVLLLTNEGIGDYSNCTVSKIDEQNNRNEIAFTKNCHIGHIYQYMALLLGMKPAQHEYKVMGLAPYANSKEVEKSLKVYKDILEVKEKDNGFVIEYGKRKPKDLYFHFREAFEGHRFDGMAGALQKYCEDIITEWTIKNLIKTKTDTICFSGGVAQNIKINQVIANHQAVNRLYVLPAAGDLSISIGACYYVAIKKLNEITKPIGNIYLGPSTNYFEGYYPDYFQNQGNCIQFKDEKILNKTIASMLASGKIIARYSGRMEFGHRALGNRTIMADPRYYSTVKKINDAIKFRDFWMPFTPTIMSEFSEKYIINPKKIECPYMTIAFDSTEEAQKDLSAALHPADLTVRPQILTRQQNEKYWNIINEFEKITGVGGILNTSFNLHGEPIVSSPKDAFNTFKNSKLDGLLIDNYLFVK